MIDSLIGFPDALVRSGFALAIQFAILVPIFYLIIRSVRSLSAAGRWKLIKIVLAILFLPLVLFWRFATAGSECGCCCDGDD